jgi:hypothetical protein
LGWVGVAAPAGADPSEGEGEHGGGSPKCTHHEHQIEHHPDKFLPCDTPGASGGAARGDFDGDGVGDLAIGTPDEDITVFTGGSTTERRTDAGLVQILYGSPGGLTAEGTQTFFQVSGSGGPEAGDRWGAALAAGDFDGDGFTDLAVASPGEDSSAGANAGIVQVLRGSPSGLVGSNARLLAGDEAGDQFGFSMTWANFGRGGEADLVVGIPFEDVGSAADAGAVRIFYGSSSGLPATGIEVHQDTRDVDDLSEGGDRFGASLAAGEFGHSTEADLAVGVPLEDFVAFGSGPVDAGLVHVFYGTAANGLGPADQQRFSDRDVSGTAETGDQFGTALTAGQLDGEIAHDDLVVGVPFEDVGDKVNVGEIAVLAARTTTGLGPFRRFSKATFGQPSATGDQFGAVLAANDVNGTGTFDDLVVGVPNEEVTIGGSTRADAGAVWIFFGSSSFPSTAQRWLQFHTEGVVETGARFGSAVTVWNFGGTSQADLVVGAPFDDVAVGSTTVADAGSVHVLYSAGTSGISTTGSQVWTQASPGVGDVPETGDRFGSKLY